MSHARSNSRRAVVRMPKPRSALLALAAGAIAVLLGSTAAYASTGNTGFGFNAPNISGGSGAVFLTGGGAFNTTSGFAHSAGGFECTSTVSAGPLAGCQAGQGTHWDTASLLRTTGFKCTATDPAGVKFATLSTNTVVLRADFYRAGDGNMQSFTANMIVSDHDIAPDVAGVQNVWVQGVGCEDATTNFSN